MKKILIALMFITTLNAMTSDVYCVPMGEGYYWCTNDAGDEWTAYMGEG